MPVITVKGKEYKLERPTMKMWRRVAEYDGMDKESWDFVKLMDEHAKLLAEIYGIENADDIDPADVVPGYLEAATWVLNTANEKLKQLPKNAEAEAGEEK